MATIFLRHSVADYDAWRPLFDDDRPRRDTAGLTEVEAMLADEGLKAKMDEAGVTGLPEVWIAG